MELEETRKQEQRRLELERGGEAIKEIENESR